MNKILIRLAPAMALALPAAVVAQGGGAARSSPNTEAGGLQYRSAFADYSPWQDVNPADWRAVNDALLASEARKGEHESNSAAPQAEAVDAPQAPASSGTHGRDHSHGGAR